MDHAPKSAAEASQGWGPWRQVWYSICSHHQPFDPECRLCKRGQWVNHWGNVLDGVFYKLTPKLWRWWANRSNSSPKSKR